MPLLQADCGGNVEARKDSNGHAVVRLCDDDVRRSVPHHQSRGLAQVEIRSDGDSRLAGCVSGRELIQLPEQVSVDDVAICDHCTGARSSGLATTRAWMPFAARIAATVRKLLFGRQVTTPRCITLPTVSVSVGEVMDMGGLAQSETR